jgi:serine/threonine-protein kinase
MCDAVQRFLDGDRDVALRKELAAVELEAARASIERGSSLKGHRDAVDAYANAMRSAARALALDPTAKEPADLVGRLMLEPPAEVPPEVTEAIDRSDDDALFNARKLIILAAIAYIGFVPILFVVGFRDPVFVVASVIVPAVMWLLASLATRDQVRVIAYTGLLGNSLMTLLYSWVATPFLVAPSLAVVTAMSIATHPRIAKPWVLVAVIATGVLAPLGLELAGLRGESTRFSGDTVTLHPLVSGLEHTTTMITFVLYVIVLIAMAVVLARSLTGDRRAAQRIVQVQAWQLRQLMPR